MIACSNINSITINEVQYTSIPSIADLQGLLPPQLKYLNIWIVQFVQTGPIPSGEELHNETLINLQAITASFINGNDILFNNIVDTLKGTWDLLKLYFECPYLT